jgi:hypothetical protein
MNDGSVKLLSISQLKCSIASFLCQRLILLTKYKSKLCNIEAYCLLIKVIERICMIYQNQKYLKVFHLLLSLIISANAGDISKT